MVSANMQWKHTSLSRYQTSRSTVPVPGVNTAYIDQEPFVPRNMRALTGPKQVSSISIRKLDLISSCICTVCRQQLFKLPRCSCASIHHALYGAQVIHWVTLHVIQRLKDINHFLGKKIGYPLVASSSLRWAGSKSSYYCEHWELF